MVLAWKDTREARRAMSDALPFLKAAKEVVVVEICHGPEAEGAAMRLADVVAALKRHGVSATADVMRGPRDPEEVLLERASLHHADLIVAGCYGHSRMGEWIFGGMTRSLLEQEDRFVLLSH